MLLRGIFVSGIHAPGIVVEGCRKIVPFRFQTEVIYRRWFERLTGDELGDVYVRIDFRYAGIVGELM